MAADIHQGMNPLRSAKKRNRTEEVREKKDRNAPLTGKALKQRDEASRALAEGNVNIRRGPHKNKPQRGKGTKGKGKGQRHQKHKKPLAASAPRVATLFLLARQTNELIRLKYNNLGDFGGTDPVTDSWILEVAGPYGAMQELTPLLKKHKFRWNPQSKSWVIRATQYAYSNRKRQNFWVAARRNQEAVYPILQRQVKEINERLSAEDEGPQKTPKEWARLIQQVARISDRLKKLNIRVEYDYPNKYSVDEPKVWFFDTPFDLNPILKKNGFRWGTGRKGKGWWIPVAEYSAIVKSLVAEVFRKMPLPAEPSGGTAVFSDMSPQDLSRFLDNVVDRDMEFNEGYDGEVTGAAVKLRYMRALPRMKAHEQEQAMQSWLGGGLPDLHGR